MPPPANARTQNFLYTTLRISNAHCHLMEFRYFPPMTHLTENITVDPLKCGGRPCIRGMRIRVTDVLDLLAAGLGFDEILEEMPDLVRQDIIASINYASKGIDHPVIAA